MIGSMRSLIKAEDSAGEDHKMKSWWVQPGRIKPVEAEPGNALWQRRLARPERTLRLGEVPEDIGAKPHGHERCPIIYHLLAEYSKVSTKTSRTSRSISRHA